MKKNILILLILLLSLGNFVNAEEPVDGEDKIKVYVTENIPGAKCTGPGIKSNGFEPVDQEKCRDREDGKTCVYECVIEKGFGSVVNLMGGIIKYFTYLAGLGGVLYLIINGIMYSMGGLDQSLKDESKKRIIATIVGLIILFLSGVILNILAPWIYI